MGARYAQPNAELSAFDFRMMFQGYFDRGFALTETEVVRLTKFLSHAPRIYEDFAAETSASWKA